MTRLAFRRVASDGPLTVDALDGDAATLVIAFASIGHDTTRPPSPEFVRSATGHSRPALFVMDASRSWGHTAGFAEVLGQGVDAIRQRQPVTRIVTLGQSMGAYCALRAATVLPVDAVLAFGPQSRLDDPDDPRWRDWTSRIEHPSPASEPPPPTWCVLMHGMADDRAHALRFTPRKGTDHLLFADQSHSSLCPHLKAQGVMSGLVDALAQGDRRRLIRLATGAGGTRRQLPR